MTTQLARTLRHALCAFWCCLYLAGPAAAAEIILYSSPNFQGKSLRVTGDVPSLREYRFNDEVSSLVVLSGEWALYEDSNFQGNGIRVPPGSYPEMGAVLMDNNELSSLRPLTTAAPPQAKLPDLVTSIEARSGFIGDPSNPASITFRGVTAYVTITNRGEGRASASTLAIVAGPDEMTPYRAAGFHPCAKAEMPWPERAGGAASCSRLKSGDLVAKPSGAAMTCAIPALEPGASARCAVTFSVLYSWLVPQLTGWTITATADSGRKLKESDRGNNGGDSPLKVSPDTLLPL